MDSNTDGVMFKKGNLITHGSFGQQYTTIDGHPMTGGAAFLGWSRTDRVIQTGTASGGTRIRPPRSQWAQPRRAIVPRRGACFSVSASSAERGTAMAVRHYSVSSTPSPLLYGSGRAVFRRYLRDGLSQ